MNSLIPEIEGGAASLIHRIESEHIANDITEYFHLVGIRPAIENKLNKTIRRICIIPCSNFISEIIEKLKNEFDAVTLCDNHKAGDKINDIEIIDQETLTQRGEKFDAYLIPTRDKNLQAKFIKSLPENQCVTVNELINLERLKNCHYSEKIKEKVDPILKKIKHSEQPFIILDGYYFNNFTPTLQALQNQGVEVFSITRSKNIYYGKQGATHSDIKIDHKHTLNFVEMMYFLTNLKHGTIATNTVSMLCHNFDPARAIASLAYHITINKLVKIPHILVLYDVVDTLHNNENHEETYLKLYTSLLKNADALILNSNTETVATFLKNSFKIKTPSIAFYRYSNHVENLKKKIPLNDGFHVAMIGQFMSYTRDIRPTIKSLLGQGIHIHYYATCNLSVDFHNKLPQDIKPYFHLHDSIVDQGELVHEISQYHAGWIADSTETWVNMMANANSDKLRDLLVMFRMNTLASSLLCLCSAGLPTFINHTCATGVVKEFPKDFFIPIELSEATSALEILKSIDWDERSSLLNAQRKLFTIEHNIHSLQKFISNVKNELNHL